MESKSELKITERTTNNIQYEYYFIDIAATNLRRLEEFLIVHTHTTI